MDNENDLRNKLRKIEALFSSTQHEDEKISATEAIKRIKDKLKAFEENEKADEKQFSLPNSGSMRLFIALCRRYGLTPYRYARQRKTTLMLRAPQTFIDTILWPEFKALNSILLAYLTEITEKIIKEEVYKDVTDVKELNPTIN